MIKKLIKFRLVLKQNYYGSCVVFEPYIKLEM